MTSNRDILITHLQSLPLLAGRYADIKCVNYDPVNGEKRGCFSLVFRARDVLDDKAVALKFFDIDYAVLQNPYRIQAFEREPDILQTLIGRERCLQLAGGLATYELEVRQGDAGPVILRMPCKYFVVDWIDQEIDEFFLKEQEFEAEEKLRLFNEIVLAVEALHRHEIHHRDLKPDNLRAYNDALKRIVVAIDLGAAARSSSPNLMPEYGHPVGAKAYAPPEAFCGFAGERKIAHLADIYALGCLLFELFNRDLFVKEAFKNPNHGVVLAAIAIDLHTTPPSDKLRMWSQSFRRLGKSIGSISILTAGNSVPAALRGILQQMLASLTHFDLTQRTQDLANIRRLIWSAIRVLRNDKERTRRVEERKLQTARRIEKIQRREQKLREFLDRGKGLSK